MLIEGIFFYYGVFTNAVILGAAKCLGASFATFALLVTFLC